MFEKTNTKRLDLLVLTIPPSLDIQIRRANLRRLFMNDSTFENIEKLKLKFQLKLFSFYF